MSDHLHLTFLLVEAGLAVAFGTAALHVHWVRRDLAPTVKSIDPEATLARHRRSGRWMHGLLVAGAVMAWWAVVDAVVLVVN